MVLGQAKAKQKMRSCYLCGKKGHIAKKCWQHCSGQPKWAKFTVKSKVYVVLLEVKLNYIQLQMDTVVLTWS